MFNRFFQTDMFSKDGAALLLRLFFGGSMLFLHGWPKFQAFAEGSATFPDPLHIGSAASMALTIFGEFVCAVLILIGFGTRLAAIPALITMFVAAFVVHGADPFEQKELSLLYFAGFAAIYLLGPGRYSIDERLG